MSRWVVDVRNDLHDPFLGKETEKVERLWRKEVEVLAGTPPRTTQRRCRCSERLKGRKRKVKVPGTLM